MVLGRRPGALLERAVRDVVDADPEVLVFREALLEAVEERGFVDKVEEPFDVFGLLEEAVEDDFGVAPEDREALEDRVDAFEVVEREFAGALSVSGASTKARW